MKQFLLLTLLTISSFAQAQSLPWSEAYAMPIVLKQDNKFQMPVYNYTLFGGAFKEIEGYIAEIQGKPAGSVKITPEYIEYRFGRPVIYRHTMYSSKPVTDIQLNAEVQDAYKKAAEGTLKKEDLKGPNWIHLIQSIDVEEVNCLAISRKEGKSSGCADIWQDGLSDEEAVCYKGRTYLKCHVGCLEKIYNRKIETVPGFCPEVAAEVEVVVDVKVEEGTIEN